MSSSSSLFIISGFETSTSADDLISIVSVPCIELIAFIFVVKLLLLPAPTCLTAGFFLLIDLLIYEKLFIDLALRDMDRSSILFLDPSTPLERLVMLLLVGLRFLALRLFIFLSVSCICLFRFRLRFFSRLISFWKSASLKSSGFAGKII